MLKIIKVEKDSFSEQSLPFVPIIGIFEPFFELKKILVLRVELHDRKFNIFNPKNSQTTEVILQSVREVRRSESKFTIYINGQFYPIKLNLSDNTDRNDKSKNRNVNAKLFEEYILRSKNIRYTDKTIRISALHVLVILAIFMSLKFAAQNESLLESLKKIINF